MQLNNFANSEIIQVAEAVAREKSIPKEKILETLEEAIKVAAYRKYGREHQICVSIDRKTGAIALYRELLVVEDDALNQQTEGDEVGGEVEDGAEKEQAKMQVISLQHARFQNPDILVGEVLRDPLPPLDLARLAAQSAKQVIVSKIKEIEREQQYEEFKNRVGDILHGVVDRIEHSKIFVKIGTADAVLKKEYAIKSDYYKQGDRIKAYLLDLDQSGRGPQILLSRTNNQFMMKLFAQEVPEIYENIIQIKVVARDPGSRAKIAVFSPDSGIDPIGSCVGMRGSRVQAITAELRGEKIDVIEWSSDPATLAIRALAPASVTKVIVDEDKKKLEVVVPDDQQSIAIGRQGQNVRLASELIGWKIDILTEVNETKRRQDEFNNATEQFTSALFLDDLLAQLLVSEGFISIEDVADVEKSYLASIHGLNEEIADELISRAKSHLEECREAQEKAKESSMPQKISASELIEYVPNLTVDLADMLINSDIKNVTELADLSTDELIELVPNHGLTRDEIDAIIIAARKHAYFS